MMLEAVTVHTSETLLHLMEKERDRYSVLLFLREDDISSYYNFEENESSLVTGRCVLTQLKAVGSAIVTKTNTNLTTDTIQRI